MQLQRKKAILSVAFTFIVTFCIWHRRDSFGHLLSRAPQSVKKDISDTLLDLAITNKTNVTVKRNVVPANFTDDFEWFNGEKEFPVFCHTCAWVSSSGYLLKKRAGAEIDKHDCVFRMNNAPTEGYEPDVGTKTNYRIFSHTSVMDVKRYLMNAKNEVNSVQFLVWGPENNLKVGAITDRHLKDIIRNHPHINIHVLSQNRMKNADQLFEKETGRNRLKSATYLSTGWFTLLFMRNLCEEIHSYGMVSDEYCIKSLPDVSYHYYKAGLSQCQTYNMHENHKGGAHRFLTEKKVFKKWAMSWGNLYFHYPEWEFS